MQFRTSAVPLFCLLFVILSGVSGLEKGEEIPMKLYYSYHILVNVVALSRMELFLFKLLSSYVAITSNSSSLNFWNS